MDSSGKTLLIADSKNPHLSLIEKALMDEGVKYFSLDPTQLHRYRVLIKISDLTKTLQISHRGKVLKGDEINSIWSFYRHATVNLTKMNKFYKALTSLEWESFLWNLTFLLNDKTWVNHPLTNFAVDSKLHQIYLANRFGLKTPESLSSNDFKEIMSFSEIRKNMALKRLNHDMTTVGGTKKGIFTNRIDNNKLISLPQNSFNLAPIFLQDYIEKETELRIYVIGEVVISVEILSQETEQLMVDWRRYPTKKIDGKNMLDYENWKCRKTDIPHDLKIKLVGLVKELGLKFAGIDMIKSRDNQYYFLEINSIAAFAWLEEHLQLPISKNVAKVLIQKS